MKNNRSICMIAAALAAFLVGGCASKNVLFFGTNTSLGLNVAGTTNMPNNVSFAYERSELAFVPRAPSGEAHSVVGALDADLDFWGDKSIYQAFAIGQAADNYAYRKADINPLDPKQTGSAAVAANAGRPVNTNVNESLVFLTHTTTGLKIAAGEGAIAPNFLLGFRRGEAALVPVRDTDAKARSVFGELSYSTRAASIKTPDGTVSVPGTIDTGGVRIKQTFATGKAAEIFAQSPAGQKKLDAALGVVDKVRIDGPSVSAKVPVLNAYNAAKAAGDTDALKAMDESSGALGLGTMPDFLGNLNVTEAQVNAVITRLKEDSRLKKYYK